LIECLGGKAFSGKLPAEIGQTVYCYRDRLETTAALWSDRPDVTDSVLVRCDAKSAILTDMMGRTTSLKPVAGCYTIPISYEPAFFNAIGKRASIELVKSIIDAPSATLPEGELSAYEVKVENPLAVRLTGSLTFQSDTIKSSVSTLNVDVAPGKTQALPLRLQIAPGAGAMHILHVRFEPSANLPTIEKDVRLRTAVKLPFLIASESTEDRPPLVTLDPRKNLVSLYTATPMESLKFHGPADLSAKAWIWQSTEGIRVRVVVTDDVHFQREQPGSYWKGDSMQFALIGPSDKLLEWTTALTGDGPRIERSVWPSEWAGVPVSERVRVTRVGTLTTYDITIPSVIPEIGKSIEYGCRMSLLVNDNDGAGRKGWLEWTPGIGVTKDPTSFVPIAFAKP